MSSSLIDLWSVVSGLSMGGLFMYLLCNNGFTINVNVNHSYTAAHYTEEDFIIDEQEDNNEEESVELEEEVLEDDNEVVENENKQD